jgi:hypothetical protein
MGIYYVVCYHGPHGSALILCKRLAALMIQFGLTAASTSTNVVSSVFHFGGDGCLERMRAGREWHGEA